MCLILPASDTSLYLNKKTKSRSEQLKRGFKVSKLQKGQNETL